MYFDVFCALSKPEGAAALAAQALWASCRASDVAIVPRAVDFMRSRASSQQFHSNSMHLEVESNVLYACYILL